MDTTIRKESEKLQKTTVPSLLKFTRQWFFFDLKNQVAGRVASKTAEILRGKNRKDFFPNSDLGSYVVVINAQHVSFTGNNKLNNKNYYNHSGYPGGLRQRNTKTMLEKYPRELFFRIVKGMMPHTKLGNKQLKRLFIYPAAEHKHQAQEKDFIRIEI